MNNHHNHIRVFCLIILSHILLGNTIAQDIENEFESRVGTSLSFDLMKDLELKFEPELRFDEGFTLDKSLLETQLKYKPFKVLSLSSSYRFVINSRETKATEYLHRYEFAAGLQKKFNRFKPGLEVAYSNYADDDITEKSFLTYSASLKYNVPNSKLTPSISLRYYQQTSDFDSYKVRYKAGLDYRVNKNQEISLSYKLDYFLRDYKNKHILGLTYKFNF